MCDEILWKLKYINAFMIKNIANFTVFNKFRHTPNFLFVFKIDVWRNCVKIEKYIAIFLGKNMVNFLVFSKFRHTLDFIFFLKIDVCRNFITISKNISKLNWCVTKFDVWWNFMSILKY